MKQSPPNAIVLLDDDTDDLELTQKAIGMLNIDNPIVAFDQPEDLIDYLRQSDSAPFLILCDVRLGGMTGLALREQILGDQ